MAIEGLVANILNARELVINIGSQDGVSKGKRFKVLADTPAEIRDPQTNEVLGVIDREKVRVEVTEAQPRLAVCRTYETITTGGRAIIPDLSDILGPRRTVPKTLKAQDAAYLPPLSESESYVKRGDRVVEIPRPSVED